MNDRDPSAHRRVTVDLEPAAMQLLVATLGELAVDHDVAFTVTDTPETTEAPEVFADDELLNPELVTLITESNTGITLPVISKTAFIKFAINNEIPTPLAERTWTSLAKSSKTRNQYRVWDQSHTPHLAARSYREMVARIASAEVKVHGIGRQSLGLLVALASDLYLEAQQQ